MAIKDFSSNLSSKLHGLVSAHLSKYPRKLNPSGLEVSNENSLGIITTTVTLDIPAAP
jgi:hypothetical protein